MRPYLLGLVWAVFLWSQWTPASAQSAAGPVSCSCEGDIATLEIELMTLETQASALGAQSAGLVGLGTGGTVLGTLVGLQQYAYKTSYLFYSKSLGTVFAVEEEGAVPLCGVYFNGPGCTGSPAGNGNPTLGADLLGNAYIYEPFGEIGPLPDVQSKLSKDATCSPFLTPAGGYPMKKVPLPFDIPVPLPVTIKGGE